MSLLNTSSAPRVKEIAREVYERHFREDPKLAEEYDERRKALMYEDILYNLTFLDTAVYFDDPAIFQEYSLWIFHLLRHLMKDLHPDRVKAHMVDHYRILQAVLQEMAPDGNHGSMIRIVTAGAHAIQEEDSAYPLSKCFLREPYPQEKKMYLDRILHGDTRGAIDYVNSLVQKGMPLEHVYVDLIQEVMYEIGELWHQNEITIDKEHYATSVSQMVLSRYYDDIFSRPRVGKTLISCCVGSELHEMGARMVSDLFEYHGWDSIYLGAAVPVNALLSAIEEHQPELLALSVTMSPHLVICADMIRSVRSQYPNLPIAVGGRAFTSGDDLWQKLQADFYGKTALDLIAWVKGSAAERKVSGSV